ncbi:TPA: hypothetical protein R1887_005315 [Klebsiella oxytoca]|nr:hypothetical protein [Klebsiella oxytoca]
MASMERYESIKTEVNEIKHFILARQCECPTAWQCIWPGIVFLFIFVVSTWLSFWVEPYGSELDKIASAIFSLLLGLVFLASVGNARAILLSVPSSFRRQSTIYNFFGRKLKMYGIVVAVGYALLSYAAYFFKMGVLYFIPSVIVFLVLVIIAISIDLRRYQLTGLLSVINTIK